MSKPRRIVTTDCFYHLYNRFVGGYHLFNDKEIVNIFFKIFNNTAEKYGVSVYILYCMSNHFHSLLKLTEKNLSEFIQSYSTKFCRIVNKKLKRRGHVFQTRHKTQLVQTGNYLEVVVKYIYNNAVRAGIVERAEYYKWSNLQEIIDTYLKEYKYTEILELVLQKPISKNTGKEFINWLNNDNNSKDIKKHFNQFLTDKESKDEILKKIERRNKAGGSARKRRKIDKTTIKDLNKKIKLIVKNYFQNKKIKHSWRDDKYAVKHCIWYILSEEYWISLKQISELYAVNRHQTVSNAIIRIKSDNKKKITVKKIIEKLK